jgi:hypothetical protein
MPSERKAAPGGRRDPASDHPPLDELQAELFLLLDHYAHAPSPGLAGVVATQLQRMLEHPLMSLFPELQRNCAASLNRWRLRGGFEAEAAPAAVH